MLALVAIAACLSAAGCYAGVAASPGYEYDVVTAPPPARVETYPYVVYQGAPTYYVEGRWYRRYGNGWTYYRNEPTYLNRHRPGVTTAPPAYRSRPSPAVGVPPGRTSAPPAHRR